MRHRVQGTAIGRDSQHRKALIRNLLASLFQHGAIETTELKAKVVKRMADKVITKGKPGTLNARRTLEGFFGQRQIVNHIMESVVPAVADRTSGFTRITRLGKRRGDDATMVKIELVSAPVARAAKTEKPAAKTAPAEKTVETKADAAEAKETKPAVKKETKAKAPAKKAAAQPKTATKAKSKTK
jgi:large subunit ribosomal protein L17